MSSKYDLLASFHGGDKKREWNNIHAFTSEGKKAKPEKVLNVSSLPHHVKLRELRSFVTGPGGDLYVANAYSGYSQIIRFKGTVNHDGQHDFKEVFTQYNAATNPGLVHPFQVTFSHTHDLFVSSQDTNCVLRYAGPDAPTPGVPMPLPQALSHCTSCFPGTFIPALSSSTPEGLTSVRGAIHGPHGSLWVADEDANAVYQYDGTTGKRLKTLLDPSIYADLDGPDHLFLNDGVLYIGNTGPGTILAMHLGAVEPSVRVFFDNSGGHLDGPAGMCFGPDGDFYVASRRNSDVLQLSVDNGQASYRRHFLKGLNDNPEFIQWVRRMN